MKHFLSCVVVAGLFCSGNSYADTVIWSGSVSADGTRVGPVELIPGQSYRIKVNGTMSLTKWWKAGLPLKADAVYEFNANSEPAPLYSFKNNLDVAVSDGKYHADHLYQSAPFMAVQSGIDFWIYDTDYSDNSGALEAQVIKLDPPQSN